MCSRDRSGFTLIEIILSLSLLGMVIVTVLSLYQFSLINWEREQEMMDLQDNLRTGLNRLAREVRQATVLHPESGPNKIKFYNDHYQPIQYFLEKTTLYRKSGTGVKQPVADNITGLEFKYGSRGLVTIKVTGKTSRTKEISYTTAVRIRTLNN